MKKTIGNYTPDAGKVMKQSERVICCTGDDGMIYVTNGYLAYKFTPREYTAAIQPAVCCEAGNWTMNNGQKTEEPPTFDLAKTFRDAEHKAAGMEALERCPLNLDTGKKRTAAAFYNAAQGFAALYNAQYLEALAPVTPSEPRQPRPRHRLPERRAVRHDPPHPDRRQDQPGRQGLFHPARRQRRQRGRTPRRAAGQAGRRGGVRGPPGRAGQVQGRPGRRGTGRPARQRDRRRSHR